MNSMQKNYSAVILAGGESRRMGFNKAFLKINNKYLINSIIKKLNPLFKEIIVINGDEKLKKIIENKNIIIKDDIIKNKGPLGGIYTALKTSNYKNSFVFACDMPAINTKIIKLMIDKFEKRKIDSLMPDFHPLHAIYSNSLAKNLITYLQQNKNLKIKGFLDTINYEYFKLPEELKTNKSFYNINSEEDLRRFINL